MAKYMTFADLYAEVERGIKAYKGARQTLVKHIINNVYLNELIPCDDLFPLYWLVDFDDTLASLAPATITGITKADPGVITVSAAHGLSTSDIVSIYGIVGMTELNNRTFLVNSVPAGTTLSLIDLDSVDAIDSTSFTAWASGGTVHHRGRALSGRISRMIDDPMWHDEQRMTPIVPKELEAETQWWGDNTSRPSRYMLRKKFLANGTELSHLLWFPCSDAAYDLRYWKEIGPSKLVNDADVPLLPPEFHPAIVSGSITRLQESQVQVEAGVVWPTIYAAQVAAIREYNRKFWKDSELSQREKPYLL
jgi:hypothetical protein